MTIKYSKKQKNGIYKVRDRRPVMIRKVLIAVMAFMMTFSMLPWNVYAFTETEPETLLQAIDVQPAMNSRIRHEVCGSLSEAALDYYKGPFSIGSLRGLSGAPDDSDSYLAMQDNPLYDRLQELMQTTLDKQNIPAYDGYAEGALAYYWSFTDTSPEVDNTKTSHFLMFYSDVKYEYPGANLSMNREHVWPKSHASFFQMNGGSDLHHLRPSVYFINDAKSDHVFGYVDEVYTSGYDVKTLYGKEVYKAYPDKDVFEPKDDVKGDVARILLYVYCCWGQPNLYSDVSADKLPVFDPDDTTNTGGRVIADLDTLLTWCADDPVDTWELERNDLTQEVQGNRNVFIDYPELAWKLFGRSVPPGLQTPTHTGCSHSYGDPVISYDDCLEPGTQTEICAVCGNKHTLPAPIRGHIDEDNDSHCDRCSSLILGEFHAADSVSAGDHIIIYHPASGKAITPVVNSKSQLNGTQAVDNEGIMIPTDDTAVFYVEEAGEDGVHLIRNGKYLTTVRSGNKLLWTDNADDDYITWRIESAGDSGFYIVNARAGSPTKPQAVEFFNYSFTTYGLAEENRSKDKDAAYRFKLFSMKDHIWDETSRKDPTCTEPGKAELKCVACGAEDEKEISAPGHKWGSWKEKTPASAAKEGTEARTCSVCGAEETRAIPAKGETPSKAQKVKSTRKTILVAKGIARGKRQIGISWKKVSGADRYVIYLAQCGKTSFKNAGYVSGKKSSWTIKRLKKNTAYKFYVAAEKRTGSGYKRIAKSCIGHVITGNANKKYTNPKSLQLKKTSFTIRKGKSAKIAATVRKARSGKKLLKSTHAAKLRFRSTDPGVAKVNAGGRITGVKTGKCKVYVLAANGIWKAVNVTVK